MSYTHEIKIATGYATAALDRIRKENLPPSPQIFELWYVYYSKQKQEVTKAIDALISSKVTLSMERCSEIYNRFLSKEQNTEFITEAGNKIQSTIQNVSGIVKNVKSATHEYGGKLGGYNELMDEVHDPTELKKILATVMVDTHSMMEQNQKLEKQLDHSSVIMEELHKDLEKVRREAMTDPLTHLSNRKAFDIELSRIHEKAVTENLPFTLLMLDIDHFKNFNDSFGHQVGDQVLRLVARALVDGVKGRDVTARYGGEEFAIVLPETDVKSGVIVANALRKAVASKDVVNRVTGDTLGNITLSGGVAEYAQGESMEALIERADAALYAAKKAGRNQIMAAPKSKAGKNHGTA